MITASDFPDRPSVSALRAKIGWLCQLIRWLMAAYLCWVLYLCLEPVLVDGAAASAKQWASYWHLPESSITSGEVYANRAIALVSWASSVILGYAVWQLMSAYLAGEIFSAEAARRLRMVGLAALFAELADIIVRPFMLAALSPDILKLVPMWDWVIPVDLMYLLIALFILSLGHIQRTAAAISDEHGQFI